MKNFLIVILLSAITFSGFSQNNFRYRSRTFNALAESHKTLAVLPFDVRLELRPRQLRNMTPEELRQLEINEGKAVQAALEGYILRKKGQKGFKVNIQNVANTNSIFTKNNITPDNIAEFSRIELAQMLGVDGIIYGSLTTADLMSNGTAFLINMVDFYANPLTNVGDIMIKIADANSGEVIWHFETGQAGGIGSRQNGIVNNMLRRTARRFPYKRIK